MSEIGIYHIGEAESSRDCLITSKLLQGDLIESEADCWYGSESVFAVGDDAEKMRRKMIRDDRSVLDREVFSKFKRDLMHSMGGEAEHTHRFRSEHTDVSTTTNKEGHLEEPRNIATSFVGTIIRHLLDDLPSRFDNSTFKLFFTRPVGDGRTSKYQRTLKEKIVPSLKEGIKDQVKFPDKSSQYEYEPYGAFQYVLRDDYRFQDSDRRPSYLILDVGGATTDITFVQSILGNRPSASPVSESLRRAGSDYDEILLKKVNSRSGNGYDEDGLELRKNKVLPRVKNKKEEASKHGTPIPLEIGTRDFEIKGGDMTDAFDEWWGGGVKRKVQKCISEAKKKADRDKFSHITPFDKIDHVFLVGGASQLRVYEENLLGTQLCRDFDLIDENAVTVPEELEVDSSLLASLGQAVSIRDVDDETGSPKSGLQKADVVEGRFTNSEGEILRFQRQEVQGSDLMETSLRYEPEDDDAVNLFSMEEDLNDDQDTTISWDKFGREVPSKVNEDVDYLKIEVKSEFSNDWREVEKIDLKETDKDFLRHKLSILNPNVNNGKIDYKHISKIGGVSRYEDKINDNDVEVITNRQERHKRVEIPLQKTYDINKNDVFICIDIGMTNSTVSVYSPNKTLPKDKFEPVTVPELKSTDPSERERAGDGETGGEENGSKEVERGDTGVDGIEGEATKNGDGDDVTEGEDTDQMEEENRIEDPGSIVKRLAEINESINNLSFAILDERSDADYEFTGYQDLANDEYTGGSPVNYRGRKDKKIDIRYSYPQFKKYVTEERGYFYEDEVLKTVWSHAIGRTRRILVLTGPPGMGKTSLAQLLAEFFNPANEEPIPSGNDTSADIEVEEIINEHSKRSADPYFELIPVSPAWLSPRDLLGSYDELEGHFNSKPFLDFCLRADAHYRAAGLEHMLSRKFFACLDEFNLSHPEKYLSHVLSIMEEEYSDDMHGVDVVNRQDIEDDLKELVLKFPHNLQVIGTINDDPSTKKLSPKVLDRSVIQRVFPSKEIINNYVDERRPKGINTGRVLDRIFRSDQKDEGPYDTKLLENLLRLGKKGKAPISFRTIDKIFDFLKNHPDGMYGGNIDIDNLTDQVLSKFVVDKLPSIFGATGQRYEQEIESILSRDKSEINHNNLSYYENTRKIIESIRHGNSGQTSAYTK